MPYTIWVKCHDEVLRAEREALAGKVIGEFSLPTGARLGCFLDDIDWERFKNDHGRSNRGIHVPTTNVPQCPNLLEFNWPDYVARAITFPDELGLDEYVCDNVIYLHGSTCLSRVGLTMTLAHELQHFLQHANHWQEWAWNSIIVRLTEEEFMGTRIYPWDLPIEREARIVSKQVAEKICGAQPVELYVDERVRKTVDQNDRSDWQFVQTLRDSRPYELANENRELIQGLRAYGSSLKAILQEFKNDPCFNHHPRCKDLNLADFFADDA